LHYHGPSDGYLRGGSGSETMKWIALALFIMIVPAIAAWLRTNPRGAHWVWGLLGFLPFVLGPWHLIVAPYSTPGWSGYVKGWEVGLLDSVALGVLLGTRGRWPRITLAVPFAAYILTVVIAIHQAKFGNLAFSYVVQLMRAFLLFLAVSRTVMSKRGEEAVLTGLVLGLAVQAGYAIWARAGGALQTGGSLGHQNLLGFVSHLVLMPAFAMFLVGRWKRAALIGVVSGVIVVILTASRATIAFSAIGLGLTLMLSIAVRFTTRKAVMGALATLMLVASYPLAKITLERRFQAQRTAFFTEDKEREAFAKAAHAMLAAKPMGVGPNHYVFIANTEGYSARAGVGWATGSRSTNVHNSYLLVAAETGYLGLIAMLALLASAIWYAVSTAVRFRGQPGAEILVGVASGIVAMCVHGLFEWMFVVSSTQYIFAITLGVICGLRGRLLITNREEMRLKRQGGVSPAADDIVRQNKIRPSVAWASYQRSSQFEREVG
jgi:O-antigen ligase